MSSPSFKGLSWPQWVDRYIDTQLGGKSPSTKLHVTFTASNLRAFLYNEGHPQWAQASMFLQLHKYQMRWGTTEYMLRCAGKGPSAYWVVSNYEDAKVSMQFKINDLSLQHVNDILCRAKRMAEGNHTVDGTVIGGAFVGDDPVLEQVKKDAHSIIAQWSAMRVMCGLKEFDFSKSWNRKYATTI